MKDTGMNWFRNIFSKTRDTFPANEAWDTSPSSAECTAQDKPPSPPVPTTLNVSKFDREHFCGTTVLCDAYLLTGRFSLNVIADFVRKTRDKHPDAHLFATLDDAGQAAYTCTHSQMSHDLDALDGHDETQLPESAYHTDGDDRYFIGYFQYRFSNFMKAVQDYKFQNIKNQLFWVKPEDYSATLRTRGTVHELDREDESLVQIAPVTHPAEAIVAFPNGYFSDDLNPFENYVLARELYDRFELTLFGVGATYLGFMAETPISDEDAKPIATFLVECVDAYNDEAPLLDVLQNMLRGQTEIYIAYGAR